MYAAGRELRELTDRGEEKIIKIVFNEGSRKAG